MVNALNLFDNMDGAASSIALVISIGVAITGAANGDVWLAVAAAALGGACLGFLPHNLAKPARIFLGDGGSMPVGFALAALVMIAAGGSAHTWQALAIGILLVGVPALDTCLVIVSRRRRGISILTGGRDHLTHRAFQRLRTTRAVAFSLGAVQAILAALALLASRESSVMLVVVILLYLVGSAVTITVLDRGAVPAAAAASASAGVRDTGAPAIRLELPVLFVLGLGAGISPFFGGFYDQTIWAPVGLGLLVLLIAVVIARPVPISRPAAVALGALAGLGALALVSSSWADSATNAIVNGNRYIVYAAFLALVLLLVRDARAGAVLVGAFALGAVCVAAVDLARMFDKDVALLFIGGRLNGAARLHQRPGRLLPARDLPLPRGRRAAPLQVARRTWAGGRHGARRAGVHGAVARRDLRAVISLLVVLAPGARTRGRVAAVGLMVAAAAAVSTKLARRVPLDAPRLGSHRSRAAVALLIAAGGWPRSGGSRSRPSAFCAAAAGRFEGLRDGMHRPPAPRSSLSARGSVRERGTIHRERASSTGIRSSRPDATGGSRAGRVRRGQPLRLLASRGRHLVKQQPLAGVGAGNYPQPYYLRAAHLGGDPPAAQPRAPDPF